MAVIMFDYAPPGSPTRTLLGAMEFDCVLSENHGASASATEHPVEKGAPISDHVRPNLIKVSLIGTITNSPLLDAVLGSGDPSLPLQIRGVQTPIVLIGATKKQVTEAQVSGGYVAPYKVNGFRSISTPITTVPATYVDVPYQVGGRSLQFPVRMDRINAAYEILLGIVKAGALVVLSTKLKEYPEMVLLDVKAPRVPEDSLDFQLDFQEFRNVDTQEVNITRKRQAPAEKRAESTVDQGTTPTYDFGEEDTPDLASLAKRHEEGSL